MTQRGSVPIVGVFYGVQQTDQRVVLGGVFRFAIGQIDRIEPLVVAVIETESDVVLDLVELLLQFS